MGIDKQSAQFEKNVRSRFVVPEDIYGNLNTEYFEAAKAMDEHLSRFPDYVGLTLRGSGMLGYNDSASDIDLSVFHDSSKGTAAAVEARRLDMSYSHGRQLEHMDYDLNIEELRRSIPGEAHHALEALAALCELSVVKDNDRLLDYKRTIGQILRALPEEDRSRIIDGIITLRLKYDGSRIHKAIERLKIQDFDHKAFLADREKIWRARAATVFNIQ